MSTIPWPSLACLLVGAAIGAAQGYWVAYLQDPLLHRHAGRHAGVQGPCARAAAGPVGGTVPAGLPETVAPASFRSCCPAQALLHPTSLLLGVVLTAGAGLCQRQGPRARNSRMASRWSPIAFFCRQDRGAVGRWCSLFTFLIASHRGLPNVLVIMTALIALYGFVTAANGDRPAHLCARRQRESRQAVRHQDRTAHLLRLRQHGSAGRAGRAGLRRPPQHGHAQGRRSASSST